VKIQQHFDLKEGRKQYVKKATIKKRNVGYAALSVSPSLKERWNVSSSTFYCVSKNGVIALSYNKEDKLIRRPWR
jgi:hypothetical protein